MILISVILPVRNGESTIVEAIESIRTQTYSGWELVIVDDASTDNTPSILSRYAALDERIRVIRLDVNRGIAAALNLAWRSARGEYIARMDSDDICLPDRLRLQLEYMESHLDVAVLGTGVTIITSNKVPVRDYLKPQSHEQLKRLLLRGGPFFHPTVLFRRSFLLETGGYDEQWRRSEDFELWSRTFRAYRFANLQVPLLLYRLGSAHGGSAREGWERMRCSLFCAWRDGYMLHWAFWTTANLGAGILRRIGLRKSR